MNFEWDPRKDSANQRKHGVGFREPATVFADPLSITFADPDHSESEERFVTVGVSANGRVLIVAHTDQNDIIRIISTRPVTRSERDFYEEKKK
jgi:hypothetical protein